MQTRLLFTIVLCICFLQAEAQTLTPLTNRGVVRGSTLSDRPYPFNGRFYFISPGAGTSQLAFTDGTNQGTNLLRINGRNANNTLDLPTSQFGTNNLVAVNTSKLLFFIARESGFLGNDQYLWCTDGTTNGTVQLTQLGSNSTTLSNAVVLNDKVYFVAQEFTSVAPSGFLTHLFVSDGTRAGTQLLRRNVSVVTLFDNKLYFLGSQSTNANATANVVDGLYESDGTLAATRLLQNLPLATDVRGSFDFISKNTLIFSLSSFSTKNAELWCLSKRNGLQRLLSYKSDLDADVGLTTYGSFAELNNTVLFRETNLKRQTNSPVLQNTINLLRTDGTAAGTTIFLSNLPSSVDLANSFVRNNRLYYFSSASNSRPNIALWATDGTERGTSLIKIVGSGSVPSAQLALPSSEFYTIGQSVYFFGDSTYTFSRPGITPAPRNGYLLYKTDGTQEGTIAISDLLEQRTNVVALNDRELYFSDWSYIYQSDGTRSGTKRLIRLESPVSENIEDLGSGNFLVETERLSVLDNRVLIKYALGSQFVYSVLNPTETPTRCNTNIRLEAQRYSNNTNWRLCGDETSDFRLIPTSLDVPSASSLQWQRNGVDIPGATGGFYDVNQNGDYRVRIQANGCSATSMVQRIEVNKPKVSLVFQSGQLSGRWTGGFTIPIGEPNRFTGRFSLKNNGREVMGGSFLNTVGGQPGTFYTPRADERGLFTLVVTDDNRCTDSASVNVGGLNVTLASPSTSLCAGSTLTLSASVANGTAPFTYQWRRGTTVVANNSASLTINQAGVYSLTVTDATNNQATSSITINEGRLSASIAGATNICSGSSTTLTAVPTCGQPPYSYQWQRDEVAVGSASTLTVTAAGAYRVIVTDSQGAISSSLAVNVSQRAAPNATVTVNGPTSLVPGGSVVLTVPTATGQTYQWLRDGQPIAGATASSFTATQAGSYAVTVSRDGCVATSAATMVDLILAVEYPLSGFVLEASPNPANGWLRIRLSLDSPTMATFRFFDGAGRVLGVKVFGTEQRTHEHTFSIDNLPSGIFYLRAESNDKQITKKIVKE